MGTYHRVKRQWRALLATLLVAGMIAAGAATGAAVGQTVNQPDLETLPHLTGPSDDFSG